MSTNSSMANNKPYLASVSGGNEFLLIIIINEKTQESIDKVQCANIQEAFDFLLPYKSKLKAVFVNMIQEPKKSIKCVKEFKEFLKLHSIPYYFCSVEYWLSFNVLVAANITPNLYDDMICVNVDKDDIALSFQRFSIDGYSIFGTQGIRNDKLENVANCMVEMMKHFNQNMKKVILFSGSNNDEMFNNLVNLLRSNKSFDFGEKLVIIHYPKFIDSFAGKTIVEMAKWFFDRSYIKFHIIPFNLHPFQILGIIGDSKKKLLQVEHGQKVPFTKSIIFNKSVQSCLMLQLSHSGYDDREGIHETLEINRKCHQHKLTVSMESECFPDMKVEPIILPQIEHLPQKLNANLEVKIPMIGFFRNSSVICVHEDDGYEFLESWNGLYGNELFINFEESKPKFGMDSIYPEKTKMSFVVYDLIKIMSMPAEKITVNESWKFKITKDSENPVLLEFDNFDGNRKIATPAFLLAMLLKEQRKLIKNEMKEKPKEIGFCFFDKFSDVEKNRVKIGVGEACELLKIGYKFIDV